MLGKTLGSGRGLLEASSRLPWKSPMFWRYGGSAMLSMMGDPWDMSLRVCSHFLVDILLKSG
jgi:hypothetical protein